MKFDPNYLGNNGFLWFIGVVEDRNDPLKMGRVRVRCAGHHTSNKTELPTDHLPWAAVGMPLTSSGTSEVGESPSGLVEGSHVVGFFIDGVKKQEPLVLCTYAGIPMVAADTGSGFHDPRTDTSAAPKTVTAATYTSDGTAPTITSSNPGNFPRNLNEPDTARLARKEADYATATIVKRKTDSRTAGQTGVPTANGGTWSEPAVPYNATYPYNHVRQTESGHVQEFDDTPNAERVHTYHRTGSFQEFHPNGDLVEKSVRDKYDIVHKDSFEHVEGSKKITIDKGGEIYVNKDGASAGLKIKVGTGADFDVEVVGGNAILNVTGNISATCSGNADLTVGGNVTADVTGNTEVTTAQATVNGPTTINGNTTVNGTLLVSGAVTAQSTVAVTGALSSSTSVADPTGTMAAMRTTYNSHTHSETGGTTAPPSPTM